MTRAEPRYFFDEGLRFSCTRCGQCCTGGPGVVRVNGAEVEALAAHIGMDAAGFSRRFVRDTDMGASLTEHPDGRCIFFDNGCTVYEARPAQCRVYPFWVRNLRSSESWAREARECPGMGQGRLWTREEIMEQVSRSPV